MPKNRYQSLDAYAPQKAKNTKLSPKLFFSFCFFIIFMLTIFTCLLANTALAAEDQLTLEVWQNSNIKDTYYLDQTTDLPMLPAKKLSEICAIPIGWYTTQYGAALTWGRQEIGAVLLPNRPEVFAISGGNEDNPTIYQYANAEKPLIIQGQLCVPISALPFMGIDYKLLPIENKIQIYLPDEGYQTIDPDRLWQLTKARITKLLTPPITTKLLASITTKYKPSEVNRTTNLLLSTEAIHATVVKPGQTFSFNKTVGERTPQRGYKKAIVFSAQEKVMGYGGGICQVSTTLYQSVRKASLTIKERHSHSLPVSYATKGNDATVAWGSKDFRFINNTKQNIYIVGKLNKGKLTIEIWQGQIPKNMPAVYAND